MRKYIVTSAVSLAIGGIFGSKLHQNFPQKSDDSSISCIFGPVLAASPVVPSSNTALTPNRVSEIMKHGFPSLENVRTRNDYVLSYDRRNRNPSWVFEHLTPQSVTSSDGVSRDQSNFFEDKSINKMFRATNSDYAHSGYDRGHLAAAGNYQRSQEALNETFVLSNISPQVGVGFNRGAWNQLEKYTRSVVRKNRNTYVCTGPLYLPRQESDGRLYVRYEVIGQNNVAVPTHFFKILLIENHHGDFEVQSFALPNDTLQDNIPLRDYFVPIDSIQRAAGLLFFDKLNLKRVKAVNGVQQH